MSALPDLYFENSASRQRGASLHRQVAPDLVHLSRNSGPEIAIARSDIEIARHSVGNRAKRGPLAQPVASSASSLLLDALDTYGAEAGANVCLKLRLFDIECLERVYIGKLQEHHAIWWRRSAQADRFVQSLRRDICRHFL
jgi:hypothetical protein